MNKLSKKDSHHTDYHHYDTGYGHDNHHVVEQHNDMTLAIDFFILYAASYETMSIEDTLNYWAADDIIIPLFLST